jgi:PIN domain nuclease of toxin-antitoxin system
MKFLLDTCALIWWFEGSDSIPEELKDELTDPVHDVFMSDVSLLEIVIKYQLGKLPLPKPPSRLILPLARKHMIELALHGPDSILALEKLPLLHRDPFDRLLVAQAITQKLTLVTPDPKVHQYDVAYRWR